jgi:hypothetical protein
MSLVSLGLLFLRPYSLSALPELAETTYESSP